MDIARPNRHYHSFEAGMNRPLYALGWSYVALCGLLLVLGRKQPVPPAISAPQPRQPPPASFQGEGGQWFAGVRPFCNAVEVGVRQSQVPPPATVDGAGYSAACYALAGKIDEAKKVIDALPASQRSEAAGIVFGIGHPVADAGDDKSAGPIMRLVIDYQPDNYMALYHAGMSEYILGQADFARTHLEKFMALYPSEDGWRGNAREVLKKLEER
jgi:tetratricopeptide (TPR) repeat protein